MATLIRHGRIVQDSWKRLDAAACRDLPTDGNAIVPLACLQCVEEAPAARRGRLGVLLEPADDPAALAPYFGDIALVAVNFPRFVDGRGYSIARRLREALGYRGELRAVGDVQRDQLRYLARCGFDAFDLREGEDADAALLAFAELSDAYQAAADQPLPLFRRRQAV